MVTAIQLGNFFTANGRSVLGGVGGSGIDTRSLLEGLVGVKRIPATKLEATIKSNGKKMAALSELNSLMKSLKDAANFLRNPPGVGNASENVFRYTTVKVTSSTGSGSYVTVSAAPGATVQTYTIDDIASLATATKQTTETISVADADTSIVSATPSGDEFKAGTFTLNGQEITLNVGDSLNTVVAKFNAVKDTTGIAANLIKIADGQYQISYVATATGTANDFDFNNVDPAGTLVDASSVFGQITIADVAGGNATDAVFTLNGVEITRSSNSISDVVDGLTFTLTQATPDGTTVSVDVQPDESLAKSGIVNFANAYNELRIFAAKQHELNDDGTYAETAVLANNNTMRSTLSNVDAVLASIVSGITGDNPDSLSDIGITFADLPESSDNPFVRNILSIDEDDLEAAIATNHEGVRRIFEFDFISDNPNVRVYSRSNALSISEFTLNVNPFKTQTTSAFTVNLADSIVAASATAGMLTAGTVTINGQNVVLTAGMTAAQVEAAFDAAAGTTGVSAAITGTDGSFQLVFTSTVTGGAVDFDLTSDGVDATGVFEEITITAVGEYKVTYDDDGPVTIDIDAEAISTGSGYTLTGVEGTVLEGLVLIYGGNLSSNAEITVTHGIADKIYNISDDVLDTATGGIAVDAAALQASDNKLTADIKKIDEQIARFRETLLEKFAALEQAIAKVNTLLQTLDAYQQAARNARS